MANVIGIDYHTDTKDWSDALERMVRRIDEATAFASMEAGGVVQRKARGLLNLASHGELTFSPMPEGAPPARVSGALAASIEVHKWGADGAAVGPTTRYGRIQELGGTVHGHMRYRKMVKNPPLGPGIIEFRERFSTLPKHPYLKPATVAAVDSGDVREVYARYWWAAIEE